MIGGGRCVWDDLERFGDMQYAGTKRRGPDGDKLDYAKDFKGARFAVNDIGQHYMGHIDHWCTLHPEFMGGWLHFRQTHVMSGGQSPMTHSDKHSHNIDTWWQLNTMEGTSGLLGVFVALLMGYDPVIVAGIPMDGTGHYFDPPGYCQTEFAQRHIRQPWENAARDIFDGRVKSMSGWTAQLLGTPDGHTW